jgi:integrase
LAVEPDDGLAGGPCRHGRRRSGWAVRFTQGIAAWVRRAGGVCRHPLNLVQKWLGHAQLTTTAIYANAVGEEEQSIATRMW